MRDQVTASDHLCLPDALSFDFEFFVYFLLSIPPFIYSPCTLIPAQFYEVGL